ncbi:hypothetical protein OTU49_011864, partial [Cherax quadricarinatus]
MAGTCVTVLCPNGRRVVVTVTPNTSILQIIEDACKKEGFNPDQYKLKHLHRMLDISSTVRYAGLPNKCQLELVEADVPRTVENVTVIIATDSGERLTHDFLATKAEHLESKKQDTSAQASSQEKTRPEVQNIHPDKTCVQPRLQPMQQEQPSCQSLPKLSPDLVCSSQSIVSDVNHSKIDLPQPNTT